MRTIFSCGRRSNKQVKQKNPDMNRQEVFTQAVSRWKAQKAGDVEHIDDSIIVGSRQLIGAIRVAS